jgi:hypothetical protein
VGLGALSAPPAGARSLPAAAAYGAEVPAAWFALALDLVRTTPGFSPPVASRAFGYAGVALREALAPGLADRRSLAGRLNGLTPPRPPADVAYHWPTVANSALATIVRSQFATASTDMAAAIDDLERRLAGQAPLAPGVHRRSAARGAAVARHVFDWSTTDGGHEGYLRNFPPYTPPAGPGLWVPTPPGFMPALQPFWGANRPFVLAPDELDAPGPPPAYSEQPGSPFHSEALECYRAGVKLSPEQEAIARFWSDDPGETATPPGHSISILTHIVQAHDRSLDDAAEAYGRVGIAIADAFIACWRTKFRHHLIRPVTYVNRVIDPGWTPLLITPPFPEYTSGHSVQSAAAAQVLTDLLGDVAFTDRTHDRLGLPVRSFPSFAAAAEEAAISRLYGGIHFRAAIERGLEQGRFVGARVSARLERPLGHPRRRARVA